MDNHICALLSVTGLSMLVSAQVCLVSAKVSEFISNQTYID